MKWETRQWLSLGVPSSSWDVYQGEERIVSDLMKGEAEAIVEAHNKCVYDSLVAEVQRLRLELIEQISRTRYYMDRAGDHEVFVEGPPIYHSSDGFKIPEASKDAHKTRLPTISAAPKMPPVKPPLIK